MGSYPLNSYGLVDMIGNIWEWTTDWYQTHSELADACCTAANPLGGEQARSIDPRDGAAIPP
jgi:formylglycine-generating enzyme